MLGGYSKQVLVSKVSKVIKNIKVIKSLKFYITCSNSGSIKGVRTKHQKLPKVLKVEYLKNDLRPTI